MTAQLCAVCGRGGFWVGYDSKAGEDRCVNHCEADRLVPDDATPVSPDFGSSD